MTTLWQAVTWFVWFGSMFHVLHFITRHVHTIAREKLDRPGKPTVSDQLWIKLNRGSIALLLDRACSELALETSRLPERPSHLEHVDVGCLVWEIDAAEFSKALIVEGHCASLVRLDASTDLNHTEGRRIKSPFSRSAGLTSR